MAWDVYHNFVQRWKQQAGEWRQRQLLKLNKPRVVRRLYIPSIARGLLADDPGDPKVRRGGRRRPLASSSELSSAFLSVAGA